MVFDCFGSIQKEISYSHQVQNEEMTQMSNMSQVPIRQRIQQTASRGGLFLDDLLSR
jgi:hypothetical protein